jgi:hypothetical protein
LRKTANTKIAFALAAFITASPFYGGIGAQENSVTPSENEPTVQQGPTRDQQLAYQDIKKQLGTLYAHLADRKDTIASQIKERNPDLSANQVEQRALKELFTRLRAEAATARAKRIDDDGYMDLSAQFSRSVRGCTADHALYEIPYTIRINMEDANRISRENIGPDDRDILGVRGTRQFLDRIEGPITGLHDDVKAVAETFFQNISSENRTNADFRALFEKALTILEDRTKRQGGPGIRFAVKPVQKLDSPC